MKKSILAVLSVVALCVALPAAAQNQGDRRGGAQTGDRDGTYDRDRDRNGASQADLNAADRRLNEIYQRRVVEARASDRANARNGRQRGWYSQEAALRGAERNWIAYRDADCRYMAQPDTGRRGYEGSLRSCLLEHTTERTTLLRQARMDVSSR